MNTPADVMVPPVAVHVTAELKAPVPKTVTVHVAVCVVRIDDGAHATATEVIVGAGTVTVTVVEPDFVVSCVDLAVTVTVPAVAAGVKSPEELIVPLDAV
ncbi:MAG: hypothetical protein ABI147_06900 [Acidobacteriaceae bacterium]